MAAFFIAGIGAFVIVFYTLYFLLSESYYSAKAYIYSKFDDRVPSTLEVIQGNRHINLGEEFHSIEDSMGYSAGSFQKLNHDDRITPDGCMRFYMWNGNKYIIEPNAIDINQSCIEKKYGVTTTYDQIVSVLSKIMDHDSIVYSFEGYPEIRKNPSDSMRIAYYKKLFTPVSDSRIQVLLYKNSSIAGCIDPYIDSSGRGLVLYDKKSRGCDVVISSKIKDEVKDSVLRTITKLWEEILSDESKYIYSDEVRGAVKNIQKPRVE